MGTKFALVAPSLYCDLLKTRTDDQAACTTSWTAQTVVKRKLAVDTFEIHSSSMDVTV